MTGRWRSTWLLAAVFLCSLPAVTTRIYASDEVQYFSYLRSIWFDRDVSFENEYRYFYDEGITGSAGFHETFLERRTETGLRINFGTIGSALLWAPFYVATDWALQVTGHADPSPQRGLTPPYIAAVSYASAVYGFLAVVCSAAVVRRLTGLGAWPAGVVWMGTPLLFYMYVAPPMSHACSAFAVSLFLLVWLRVRATWSASGLTALGVVAALMAMVREQDAFFIAGPIVDFTWTFVAAGAPGRLLRNAALGVVAALAAYAPQALAYWSLNGYVGPSRLVARKMSWHSPHFLEVLFSSEHGFFIWTPLALLASGGLVLALLRPSPDRPADRRVLGCLVLTLVLQVYVAGSVESWTVAGAFGQRRFVAVTPILAVGLAWLWMHAAAVRRLRWPTAVVVALAVWWNIGLMLQFGAGLMNRQALEPLRNARVNFIELPAQLPSLAYRYLFDRASFYRTRVP